MRELAHSRLVRSLWNRRHLHPVTANTQIDPHATSMVLVDLLSYEVSFSTANEVAIATRYAAVQSFQRVDLSVGSSMLNSVVPQAYVVIGCASKSHKLNPSGMRKAIGLIDNGLMGKSFAGLGHFNRSGVSGFYCVGGRLFDEPYALDYARLFVGTLYETLVRRTASGFEALNNLGVWSTVSLRGVKENELLYCWLIGRQETNSLFAENQAVIRISGDSNHWIDLLFESQNSGVTATEFRGLHSGPGIYLGPRGGTEDVPSLIYVEQFKTVTYARVETWISGL